jgi:DNA (cytosine-5)-methyltransferase 1
MYHLPEGGRPVSERRVVSLFTGAGGLDYGFEAAAFRTCVAVEVDPSCWATIAANRDWPLIRADARRVSSQEVLDAAGLRWGEVDLLLGGPPCQPFSKSAYWVSGDTKRLDDPRSETLRVFMRFVEDLRPAVFVLENVPGISYANKQEALRLLYQLTAQINDRHGTDYQLSWQVLNAADYGVPQLRCRFFLVGHREGSTLRFPDPTHRSPTDMNSEATNLLPYITAWDALGGLPAPKNPQALKVKGRWADLLPSIPEGENYLWHTKRGGGLPLFGWRTRFWSFLLKLAKYLPSWTLQAQPSQGTGPFHWDNRRLTTDEMARLQTFPQDVTILGTAPAIQRQLGNAVPSLLAEVLARAIVDQLFGEEATGPLKLGLAPLRPIPLPEPTLPVATPYLSLIGDHPDHPGSHTSTLGRLAPVAAP